MIDRDSTTVNGLFSTVLPVLQLRGIHGFKGRRMGDNPVFQPSGLAAFLAIADGDEVRDRHLARGS
jgi:hypothetical protein